MYKFSLSKPVINILGSIRSNIFKISFLTSVDAVAVNVVTIGLVFKFLIKYGIFLYETLKS